MKLRKRLRRRAPARYGVWYTNGTGFVVDNVLAYAISTPIPLSWADRIAAACNRELGQ